MLKQGSRIAAQSCFLCTSGAAILVLFVLGTQILRQVLSFAVFSTTPHPPRALRFAISFTLCVVARETPLSVCSLPSARASCPPGPCQGQIPSAMVSRRRPSADCTFAPPGAASPSFWNGTTFLGSPYEGGGLLLESCTWNRPTSCRKLLTFSSTCLPC